MIYSTLSGRVEWSWTKNAPDLAALIHRRYPPFVVRDVDELSDSVPVFTFHTAQPGPFEAACRQLVEGGYRTVTPDELYAFISGGIRPPRRSVLLTFDDGAASLWTVAYPLLRRYGLCATAFVISGLVSLESGLGLTLEDLGSGRAHEEEIIAREQGTAPFCTWDELKEMQSSGVVQIQSHTAHHMLVHVGPTIRDFLNPRTDPCHLGHMNLPVIHERGHDRLERPLVLGRPVFSARPRMEGRLRYFEDEDLRDHCEEYVAVRGGVEFFSEPGWRHALTEEVRNYRGRYGERGHFESSADCEAALQEELGSAREEIEGRLGTPVLDLCFPWYVGSPPAVAASRRAGYRSNFWGILPGCCAPGADSDPFQIPRLDARYLARLPGPGRRSLSQILTGHFLPGLHGLLSGRDRGDRDRPGAPTPG